jgi:hypothetical protein
LARAAWSAPGGEGDSTYNGGVFMVDKEYNFITLTLPLEYLIVITVGSASGIVTSFTSDEKSVLKILDVFHEQTLHKYGKAAVKVFFLKFNRKRFRQLDL